MRSTRKGFIVADTQPGELSARSAAKIIDLKLPLTWLLGVAFAIAAAFASMFFKLDELGRDVTDLKITVRAGNGTATTLQGEIAILKFRVETLESDKRSGK